MGKGTKARLIYTAALLATTPLFATPPCDETAVGAGCIETQGSGTGEFNLSASYDVDSSSGSGVFSYADSSYTVESSTLVDYSYLDPNVRGFIFAASGDGYDEVRVFIADYGESGDQFEIQLLQNGNIVYGQYGYLSASCGGGVVIDPDCDGGVSPPPPPDDDKPRPEHPPHPPHPDHPDHPEHPEHPDHPDRPKGNNGVGNGEDPQPPGNPPINDGPGTGPGNPGNRGGAGKGPKK